MQTVILAGGYGTRIMEETISKPKPMIEIGNKPILWHIMKIYSSYGFNDFIICLGYKSNYVKEYFIDYLYNNNDIEISTTDKKINVINKLHSEKWRIKLIDTGLHTKTANRLLKISKYINSNNFFMTYGDGLSNVNLKELLKFHKESKKLATVTAVKPIPRFGNILIKNNEVIKFKEKNQHSKFELINGGFFVLNKKIFKIIDSTKNQMWEDGPMDDLTKNKQLAGFYHDKFWHPIDTLRDKKYLDELWDTNKAPWKCW